MNSSKTARSGSNDFFVTFTSPYVMAHPADDLTQKTASLKNEAIDQFVIINQLI